MVQDPRFGKPQESSGGGQASPTLQLPTLRGLIPYQAEQAIDMIANHARYMQSVVAALSPAKPQGIDANLLAQIRDALSATGSHPLSIVALLGGAAAKEIRVGLHDKRIATNVGAEADGLVFWETDRLALYIVKDHRWRYVDNTPFAVTLDPDSKPADLAENDQGFLIHATDFDRLFRWTGSAWEDAPGQAVRGSFLISDATAHADFTPGAGWAFCDGSAVTRSTPTGSVTAYTTPDLLTANRFFRAAGSSSLTGGAADHDHTVDVGSQEVEAGTGATVPSETGTLTTSGASMGLPSYYTFRPYVRL